jgi:glucose/arabinose dehydrogenase
VDKPERRGTIARMRNLGRSLALVSVTAACGSDPAPLPPPSPRGLTAEANPAPAGGSPGRPTRFEAVELARFDQPWAMTYLPDGSLLVTEKRGVLKRMMPGGAIAEVAGAPAVDHGGQGGFGDVVLHPRFADNHLVYLSWAERGKGDTRGAAVGCATLVLDDHGGGRLVGLKVIWRQSEKVTGRGHFGHRLAFAPDGHLFVSSGERQKFAPAQDLTSNLGKIVRLEDDGAVPKDNPMADQGGVTAQIWSLGHRNPLGLAFDADGRLWEHEMGPKGGDELNLIVRGSNYGYPIVSNGDHYDGTPIPDHDTDPRFDAPEAWWNPVISPAGFIIYHGDDFPAWRGDGFIGGLSSRALIRIDFDGVTAREAERFDMGQRIREVEQTPDGGIVVLEDGDGGRLLRLEPR